MKSKWLSRKWLTALLVIVADITAAAADVIDNPNVKVALICANAIAGVFIAGESHIDAAAVRVGNAEPAPDDEP